MRTALHTLTSLAALFTSVAVAVTPIEIQGQNFVDSVTKKRFTILGVDYQPGGQAGYKPQEKRDPLSDKATCLRDAIMLQRLGANTIRVYNVDPTLNHDDCASIFNAAGIYMIIDVNGPFSGESIDRSQPWTSYFAGYLTRIFGVVENFKGYPNTLAFFSANEVMNDLTTGKTNPQYIRAIQRDLKAYIKNHASRSIPVGYSAADVREILQDTWAYLQCNNNDDASASDFFGLNSYSWCGGSATFESAGYNDLVSMFKDSSVPVFFSEYGCNEVKPRVFDEVAALYGDQMLALSGGLVYEYSQEASDYGLAIIKDDGSVQLRADYDNLQNQINKLNTTRISAGELLNQNIKAPACSASLINNSAFDTDFTIPDVCPGCADLIASGISNPQQGAIVPVTATTPSTAYFASSGGEIKGLNLTMRANDQANTPSNQTTGPVASSSSVAPSAATSPKSATATTAAPKQGGAARMGSSIWSIACAVSIAAWVLL